MNTKHINKKTYKKLTRDKWRYLGYGLLLGVVVGLAVAVTIFNLDTGYNLGGVFWAVVGGLLGGIGVKLWTI